MKKKKFINVCKNCRINFKTDRKNRSIKLCSTGCVWEYYRFKDFNKIWKKFGTEEFVVSDDSIKKYAEMTQDGVYCDFNFINELEKL